MLPTIKQIEILGIVVAIVVALILACYLTHRLNKVIKIIYQRRQQTSSNIYAGSEGRRD